MKKTNSGKKVSWMRISATLILLMGLITFVHALDDSALIWDGMLQIYLDKNVFAPGEPITGTAIIYNTELAPLVGGKLVLQLAQGTYAYPSQTNAFDNVFLEQVTDIPWILPKTSLEVPFKINSQEGGEYRIDGYAWAAKSKLSGASNIFYNPVSEKFTVTGNQIVRLNIMREQTTFNSSIGPVGFPANPGEKIDGEIQITNPSTQEKNNLRIGVSVCEWASAFCADNNETLFDAPPIQPGEIVTAKVSIIAPQTPSAYEIQMRVYNKGQVESMFKNRVIVSGGTAKTRKILINGLSTEDYSIQVFTAGSPDHFSYPEFKDFKIKVQTYSLGKLILEKETKIPSIKTGEVISNDFALGKTSFDELCVLTEKQGSVFDKQCISTPLKRIQEAYYEKNPKQINVKWDYDKLDSTLSITLQKEILFARIRLFTTNDTILLEDINTTGAYAKTLVVPREDMFLAVDDFDAKRQQLIPLNFSPSSAGTQLNPNNQSNTVEDLSSDKQLKSCVGSGTICTNQYVCDSTPVTTIEGACCTTKCVQSGALDLSRGLEGIPLFVWIEGIIILIFLIIIFNALRGLKDEQ